MSTCGAASVLPPLDRGGRRSCVSYFSMLGMEGIGLARGSKPPVGMFPKRVEYLRFTRSEVCRIGGAVRYWATKSKKWRKSLPLRCSEEVVGAAIEEAPRVRGALPAPGPARGSHLEELAPISA